MLGVGSDVNSVDSAGGQAPHERRVRFLEALAVLMGCEGTLGGELPDGRRPDVLRYDQERRVLFVGDAKHSESPGNRDTQARLLAYLRWLSSHVRSGGAGVFAICFGRRSDISTWVDTMAVLSHEVGLNQESKGVEEFESALLVAWSEYGASSQVGCPTLPLPRTAPHGRHL